MSSGAPGEDPLKHLKSLGEKGMRPGHDSQATRSDHDVSAADSSFELAVPELPQMVLGEYVLLEKIGAGGMGQVFKAQHRRMERLVALKILPHAAMADPDAVKRFHREVKAAAQLFHPNIVTAFDAGEQNGVHYLVMEYVDGQPLTAVVERHGPLPPDEAVFYILQAAQGLQYAHSRQVMHRDIKPGNLVLAKDGAVKILDMGTARFQDTALSGDTWSEQTVPPVGLTQSGVIIGTVDYMPPEQARDARSVDHRADIYSLGCTLYYLLTGKPVYRGDLIQTLMAHAQQEIPSLRETRRDVPERLDEIFQRMLAKDPRDRQPSMAEVIADLEDCGLGVTAPALGGTALGSFRLPAIAEPVVEASDESKTAKLRQTQIAKIPAIGVDLGTMFTRIAHVDSKNRAATVANSNGAGGSPTVLLMDEMRLSVGDEALRVLESDNRPVVAALKRWVGEPSVLNPLEGKNYHPEVLLALIVNRLATEARERIGDFKHLVLAVPAYFDDICRKAMQDAMYVAGLEAIHLVSDPMAAAVAWAHDQGWLLGKAPAEPENLLVFCLGAGICDATVMRREAARFTALATDGDTRLGGRDWDLRLADLLAEQFDSRHGLDPRVEPADLERLLLVCEQAKRELSQSTSAILASSCQGHTLRLRVTRQKFESITADLVERVRQLLVATREAAGLDGEPLGRVLLVGGATRMPMVRQMVERLVGEQAEVVQLGEDAVARGAALHAAHRLGQQREGAKLQFEAHDVNAHSLGLVGLHGRTGKRHNAILIPRNSQLPVTTKRTFKTHREGQDSVVIQILQGESDAPHECRHVGNCQIGSLPANLPAGSPVTVEFHYAASGRLTVFVESATGQRSTKEITRATGLSNVDLLRWREWVETMVLCSNF